MMLRVALILIGLLASLAPARAAERHYDIRISLDPATRVTAASSALGTTAGAAFKD